MDKQIQEPLKIIEALQDKTKSQIKEIMGYSQFHSSFDVWMYNLRQNWFFRRELLLFFNKEEEVIDISITDYFLGYQTRFYFLG